MKDHEAPLFGARFANVYDDMYQWYVFSKVQCDVIASRVGEHTILEMGAGTGRLAIPLAGRGVRVGALNISPEMLEVLASKTKELPITPPLTYVKPRKPVFTAQREGGLQGKRFAPAGAEARCQTEGTGLDQEFSSQRCPMVDPGPDQVDPEHLFPGAPRLDRLGPDTESGLV